MQFYQRNLNQVQKIQCFNSQSMAIQIQPLRGWCI
jgi:hypothetical protein